MEKSINLSLTKSLIDFNVLLNGCGEIFAAVKGAPPSPIRDEVVRLKRQGWTVKEIAKKLKIHPAEVELILEFNGEG